MYEALKAAIKERYWEFEEYTLDELEDMMLKAYFEVTEEMEAEEES